MRLANALVFPLRFVRRQCWLIYFYSTVKRLILHSEHTQRVVPGAAILASGPKMLPPGELNGVILEPLSV